MAKFCVLCGQEVNLLDRIGLSVYNTKQMVCPDCDRKFTNASKPERAEMLKQILASPHLAEAETIRARQEKAAGKPCPSCGGQLELKLENFYIGADGYGGLSSLGAPTYCVDLYACARCGRVVLYTADFTSPEDEPAQVQGEVTCPVCGTRHSELINCPNCVLQGIAPKPVSEPAPKKVKTRKPPWER